MNDKQRECAWGRIDFYIKLFLADLIIFSTLVGWVGAQVNAGEFGVMFAPTCGGIAACVIIGGGLLWAIFRHFYNLEAAST